MSEEETQVEQLPPHETSASTVAVNVATPQYFGLTPATLLFGVATATLAVAIVLGVVGHWLVALILAVAALVEIVLFVGVARRKPDTAVARASLTAVQRTRERARWLVESTSVRTEAGRTLKGLRLQLLALGERRERLLRDLGSAAYENDDESASRLREQLAALDAERLEKEARARTVAASVEVRLQESRLRVQPTVVRAPEDAE
jgi:type IV secretory pathway VirB3-like protein